MSASTPRCCEIADLLTVKWPVKLGHRLFTVPQQLQQAAAIGLRDRSHQVSHLNTLAFANASGKGRHPAAV